MFQFVSRITLAATVLASTLLSASNASAQITDTIEGGRTTVTLADTFVAALDSLHVTPGTVHPTRLQNGKVELPSPAAPSNSAMPMPRFFTPAALRLLRPPKSFLKFHHRHYRCQARDHRPGGSRRDAGRPDHSLRPLPAHWHYPAAKAPSWGTQAGWGERVPRCGCRNRAQRRLRRLGLQRHHRHRHRRRFSLPASQLRLRRLIPQPCDPVFRPGYASLPGLNTGVQIHPPAN